MKMQPPNWYARMHQSTQILKTSKQNLNLSIFFRIWFTVAIIIIIASFVVFNQLFEYVEPTSKQVIEDTLVDTGKLLATNLSEAIESGKISDPIYQNQLDKAFTRYHQKQINHEDNKKFVNNDTSTQLNTSFYHKTHSSFRVYITDSKGIVLYDSPASNHTNKLDNLPLNENAEGKDYSQWNDVYLTLNGKYGARSSRNDKGQSIMYVAQPVLDSQQKLIGVVSVGKPIATILPYINVARQRMLTTSLITMLISICLAGLVAWWLQQSIALVIQYTRSLASNAKKPSFYLGRELNELTNTIEDMKHSLENKSYVTDYVHTLTHELKSPLTAIKASGELLADSNLDEEDRQILSQTINEQSQKLQTLIDKLLLLAKVEQPNFQLNNQPINIMQLLNSLIHNQQPNLTKRNLIIRYYNDQKESDIESLITNAANKLIMADEFWLSQAIDNILTNAIHFADTQILIKTRTKDKSLELQIINDGDFIPEYALDKVFDRYFSLSHQVQHASKSKSKGTGLGLTFAKQVIEHHEGNIQIENINQNFLSGVCITMHFLIIYK